MAEPGGGRDAARSPAEASRPRAHPGRTLTVATYLAPSVRPAYEALTAAVAERLGAPARLVDGDSFDRLLDGTTDVALPVQPAVPVV